MHLLSGVDSEAVDHVNDIMRLFAAGNFFNPFHPLQSCICYVEAQSIKCITHATLVLVSVDRESPGSMQNTLVQTVYYTHSPLRGLGSPKRRWTRQFITLEVKWVPGNTKSSRCLPPLVRWRNVLYPYADGCPSGGSPGLPVEDLKTRPQLGSLK